VIFANSISRSPKPTTPLLFAAIFTARPHTSHCGQGHILAGPTRWFPTCWLVIFNTSAHMTSHKGSGVVKAPKLEKAALLTCQDRKGP
jgi:hypothetical protein